MTSEFTTKEPFASTDVPALRQLGSSLGIIFVIGLVVYGSFVFVPGFHIDDELSAAYGIVGIDVKLGRWATSLIRLYLIPQPFNGYFTNLLSIFLFSLSGFLFSGVIGLRGIERIGCAALYVAFPQFAYQLEFHVQADVIPLSYICAIISYGLLRKAEENKQPYRIPLLGAAFVALVLGLAIYQTVLLIPISLALLHAIAENARRSAVKTIIFQFASCILLSVAAAAAYVVTAKLAQHWTGLSSSESYFTAQFAWSRQPFHDSMATVLRLLLGSYQGTSYYGEGLYAFILLPALVIFLLSMSAGLSRTMLSACLLIAAILSPYGVVIGFGSMQVARTFVSQGLIFAGLWAIALVLLEKRVWPAGHDLRVIVVVGIFTLAGGFVASRLAFTDYIAWQADISTGTRVVDAIYRKYNDFDSQANSVFFYGPYHRRNFWRKDNYDAFGASFFSWDEGNPDRIDAFLKISGIADFHAPARDLRASMALVAEKLPVWPNPNSIVFENGAMIIHLGR